MNSPKDGMCLAEDSKETSSHLPNTHRLSRDPGRKKPIGFKMNRFVSSINMTKLLLTTQTQSQNTSDGKQTLRLIKVVHKGKLESTGLSRNLRRKEKKSVTKLMQNGKLENLKDG